MSEHAFGRPIIALGFRGGSERIGFTSDRVVSRMAEFIQVCTTADREETANRIAKILLAGRLASCVQVFGPINSSYWWNGKIQRAKEWTCLIKARASDYRKIEASIKRVHPYDIPEILAFPVLYGNSDYLKWIRKETARKRVPVG